MLTTAGTNKAKKGREIVIFKYVSLFSGMGGFETALNRLGGKCVLASEIDKFANQAYELLYGMETVGDITKIKAEDVPDHDLLTAGFPCQAFSVAGKRLGFEDTRGTLFFEVARIAKVKQPKTILLENVKGLINHGNGKTLNTIIQTLCDIGYTVDFEVLNSKYFGVPQNRERVFIVAVRDDLITPEPWVIEGNTVVPKGKRRIQELEGIKTFNFDWPPQDQVTKRLRDILESNVDERFYLSEEKTITLITQLKDKDSDLQVEGMLTGGPWTKRNESICRVYGVEGVSPTVTAGGGGGVEPKINEPQLSQVGYIDKNTQGNRVYDTNGVGVTVASQTGGLGGRGVTLIKDTPDMLGLLDMKGNESVRRVYGTEGVSPTLTTMEGGHREPKVAVNMSRNKIGTQAIGSYPKYRIRKLTPLECFRLQAFPDEYHEILSANGISNTQLYKMAGNAVTVSVIDAIGKRLIPYLTNNKEVITYQPAQTNYTNTPLITP